jgi:hypothetical protein
MGVVLALLATMLLSALGSSLVTLTNTEVLVAVNYRDGAETLYAAEAGAEHVMQELQRSPAWDEWLSGVQSSVLWDGVATPTLPGNRPVSVASLTADLQAESDAASAWGANNPRWQLVAHAPMDAAGAERPSASYLAVWLADDPSETDGDPRHDANGVLLVRARAFGMGGASRSVELVAAKPAAGGAGGTGIRILSWRVVR